MFGNLFKKKSQKPTKILLFSDDVVVEGTNYPSYQNNAFSRQNIINKTKTGSVALFLPCYFGEKQNFLICNTNKLDLGVLPQDYIDFINGTYVNYVFQGHFIQLDPVVKIHLDLYGSYKTDFDFYKPKDFEKELKYSLDNPDDAFFCLPAYQELNADIKYLGNAYGIFYQDAPVGFITEPKKVKSLNAILHMHQCWISIMHIPNSHDSYIRMYLRH